MKSYIETYYDNRNTLKLLLKTRIGFQDMRKAMDNRIGIKADGTKANIASRLLFRIPENDRPAFDHFSKEARLLEKQVEKYMVEILKRFPVYNDWLKNIKGISTIGAAWLISQIDIHIASTRSKIWQYAGFNPNMVYGKKAIKKSAYKPEMGEFVKDLPPAKDGSHRIEIRTNTLVRGDKATPGFLIPFNKDFRTALIGIISSTFIKLNGNKDKNGRSRGLSPYRQIYDQYKYRLENSSNIVKEIKKGGKIVEVQWKDATKGHREMAARRYMMKQFLGDFYEAWRGIEGLSVRNRYSEEYLGKVHNA